MEVTVRFPDKIAGQIAPTAEVLARRILEAFAIEGYRSEQLSRDQVSELLDLSFSETEEFLTTRVADSVVPSKTDPGVDPKACDDLKSENLPQRFVPGEVYLRYDGNAARKIRSIEDEAVHWEDEFGTGTSSTASFSKIYPTRAPAGFRFRVFKESSACSSSDDFTIRDEANALTALAFRNGFLEELHASRTSPLLRESGYSRISDDEMRKLMVESSEALARMLRMKALDPKRYYAEIVHYHQKYCAKWKRD